MNGIPQFNEQLFNQTTALTTFKLNVRKITRTHTNTQIITNKC